MSDMKKVLIIGAGFLQAYVIRRAKELGYTVYALDGDENAVGFKYADHHKVISIVDERACLEYAQKNGVDGVLTAATDYGVLTASYIAEQLGLRGLSYTAARLVKNKYLVRRTLFENHVDDAAQAYQVGSEKEAEALCERVKYPVIVKACDGSGSRGITRVDTADGLPAACKKAIESCISRKAEIEGFIEGLEYGAESFVENGSVHVLAVMKKFMTTPPYYAELGHALPCGLSAETEAKVKRCVEAAIKALGINFGSVNMDLLITEKGEVHIVDIGARMGGNLIGSHIVPIGTGIDYIGNMIKAAVGDSTDFTPKSCGTVATRLLALKAGTVKALPDFEALEKKYCVKIEHHLHCGDVITPYRTNLDGCGYVVSGGESTSTACENAEKVRNIIDEAIVRE